jgi:predicted MFS family arabinose efflux permease
MKLLGSISSNVKSYIISDSFYYAGYSVVNAFLSILITSKVTGGKLDTVGYVLSYYMLVRAVTEIPLSRWTKNLSFLSKRNIIASSYIFYGILIFLLGYSTELWHIFLIQTVLGLLDAITYPIKWGIFTKIVDKGNEELEWGFEDIASNLLPAIFTAIAGVVSVNLGLEYAFLLFAILLTISGLTFFFIRSDNMNANY